MGTFWNVDGHVKPVNKEAKTNIIAICKEFDFSFEEHDDEITVGFSDDGYYDKIYDFAYNIAPYCISGIIDASDADAEVDIRYIFHNGSAAFAYGERLLYFPGFEEELINQLPEAVISLLKSKAIAEANAKLPY